LISLIEAGINIFLIFIPMKMLLNQSACEANLFPFSKTRHVAECRVGILTISEKWKKLLPANSQIVLHQTGSENVLSLPANIIPTPGNIDYLLECAQNGDIPKASDEVRYIHHPWDLFQLNDWAIRKDFEYLTRDRISQPINNAVVVNPENIFVEEGAVLLHCTLNASTGPIYIGKNAQIMEGSHIRGPFSLGENSVVKMGSTIYGGTSIGPWCVVGGEIKNSILFENSNKAHSGYLGDSVIGAWCNLGAGTSNSNVKNTGGEVYFQSTEGPISVGSKGGLLMGDYSRSAINTSFNTATTVGVCCNIFEKEFVPKNIPDFTWGKERYQWQKALDHINNWKKMKNSELSKQEIAILEKWYNKQAS
jgi:UDP-N-acetylglucosamine diphosphorylase/glucosamine-1-phosphate N-acetyltransferase